MTRASLSAASALALSLLLVAEAHAQTAQAPAPAVIPPESPSVTSMPIAPEPEPESPARADDEERFRAFYVEAAVGYTWIDLAQFSSDNLVPDLVRVQGNGLAVAAGAGLQVAFLTFGLEGEWARYPDFDFGTLSLDLGFRLPVPVVQPYFRVGLGYGWILNVDAPDFPVGVEGIKGLVADAGVGLAIEVSRVLSIDLGFDAAAIRVKRDSNAVLSDYGDLDFDPREDGDAIGLQLALLAGVNLRF